jgi:hypothetical protein
MDLVVNEKSVFERIQELRAANDTEGWAQLLMQDGLAKEERQAIRLTDAEARAYRKLKNERRLTRTYKVQQATYERLCRLRQRGDTYWIALLACKDNYDNQAVITGVGLKPGVPRFELNAEETEAIKLREQRDAKPSRCPVKWRRVRPGAYRSIDWKWCIEQEGRNEWVAYRDGELWGSRGSHWDWYNNPRDNCYVPFKSLFYAKLAIGEFGVHED